MPYCPKCGNTVDETMVFCPNCGTPLKPTTETAPTTTPETQPAAPPPYGTPEKAEKNEKQEKQEREERRERQEKGEYGFVGFLIGGLILITIGAFALFDLTSNVRADQLFPIMLFIIGIIIIIGAVYVAIFAKRRFPPPH